MTLLRIYYGVGPYVEVQTSEEWAAAPPSGVQAIVNMEHRGHSGSIYEAKPGKWVSVRDRFIWTGDDQYDPFGWGVKFGKLIPDDQYFAIYNKACTDGND